MYPRLQATMCDLQKNKYQSQTGSQCLMREKLGLFRWSPRDTIMVHLVTHKKIGTGYALQETDGRWVVRFHYNYNKHFVFTKSAFKQGYLKDCGIVNIGDNNG